MPRFLTQMQILRIHERQIDRFGGTHGLRDESLLDSAISMPKASFDGELLHRDVFEMAAAYLFHLTNNHPFLDGNKRVGSMAAAAFLELNGYSFCAPDDTFEDMVFAVARGELEKPAIAAFFRKHTTPRSDQS